MDKYLIFFNRNGNKKLAVKITNASMNDIQAFISNVCDLNGYTFAYKDISEENADEIKNLPKMSLQRMSILERCNAKDTASIAGYKCLAISLVASGLKDKDYWFFVSDYGKSIVEMVDEKLKMEVKNFCFDFLLKTKETHTKAVECAKTLIDDNFIKCFNLFSA